MQAAPAFGFAAKAVEVPKTEIVAARARARTLFIHKRYYWGPGDA